MKDPGYASRVFAIFGGMKTTVIQAHDEYTCDICGNAFSSDYALGSKSNAGNVYLEGCTQVDYSYSLVFSKYGKPVEHICKDCLKNFFLKMADTCGR